MLIDTCRTVVGISSETKQDWPFSGKSIAKPIHHSHSPRRHFACKPNGYPGKRSDFACKQNHWTRNFMAGYYNRTSMGAYCIRPSWQQICPYSTPLSTIQRRKTLYSPTWGRMRYAPTVIRWNSNISIQNETSKPNHFAGCYKRTEAAARETRRVQQGEDTIWRNEAED